MKIKWNTKNPTEMTRKEYMDYGNYCTQIMRNFGPGSFAYGQPSKRTESGLIKAIKANNELGRIAWGRGYEWWQNSEPGGGQ